MTGTLIRMARSRVYSSITCAASPAVRPMMRSVSRRAPGTEVVEHPGDDAIDIDGDWLRTRLQRCCDRADEPHAVAGLAPFVSQAQHRDGARILAVHPMPEPGSRRRA